MKRALIIAAVLVIALLVFYSILMVSLTGNIVIDVSAYTDFETRNIMLPWYLEALTADQNRFKYDGYADKGYLYTTYHFDILKIFGNCSAEWIVSWDEHRAKLYIGRSLTFEALAEDIAYISWNWGERREF